ncbi:MAG: hypothetical protein IPG97_19515 [Microthrixaceae bacterium]|nr:hypothetical protein [Microthrixaceae bacterium]
MRTNDGSSLRDVADRTEVAMARLGNQIAIVSAGLDVMIRTEYTAIRSSARRSLAGWTTSPDTPTRPAAPRHRPGMTPGRVLAELIALDWGSWGKGATVPEAGVGTGHRRTPACLLQVLGRLSPEVIDRWQVPDTDWRRNDWPVIVPMI